MSMYNFSIILGCPSIIIIYLSLVYHVHIFCYSSDSVVVYIYLSILIDDTTGFPLRRSLSALHWVISHLVTVQGTVLVWGLQCWRLNWLSSTCSGGSRSYRHQTQRWVAVEYIYNMCRLLCLQVPIETSFGLAVTPKNGVFLRISKRNWRKENDCTYCVFIKAFSYWSTFHCEVNFSVCNRPLHYI